MKTLFDHSIFLFVLSISILSCNTNETERPATVIGKTNTVSTAGPTFYEPPCTDLETNELKSNTLNFNADFSLANRTYEEINGNLMVTIENSSYDKLTLNLKPFVREQSTIYNIVNSLSNKKYECTLKCEVNYFSGTPYDKYTLTPNPNQNLFIKYLGNNSYELSMCTAASKYIDYISGNTSNTSFRLRFNIQP
ncbi:MAG TPA: hypothetical protein VGF79_07800 [Bacteroidia bacterium]